MRTSWAKELGTFGKPENADEEKENEKGLDPTLEEAEKAVVCVFGIGIL